MANASEGDSSSSDEEEILLFLLLIRRRRRRLRAARRQIWSMPWILRRLSKGARANIIRELNFKLASKYT